MRLTLYATLALIGLAVVLDVVQYARLGWPSTISHLVLTRAQRHPILPFALGVLVGHLLWPQPDPREQQGDDAR